MSVYLKGKDNIEEEDILFLVFSIIFGPAYTGMIIFILVIVLPIMNLFHIVGNFAEKFRGET